jgi:hypothetical protein
VYVLPVNVTAFPQSSLECGDQRVDAMITPKESYDWQPHLLRVTG